jgi:hypothetical protein
MNEGDRTYAPKDVVTYMQPETTVYRDQKDQLAIRQRYDHVDIWIIVSREHIYDEQYEQGMGRDASARDSALDEKIAALEHEGAPESVS